MRFIYFLRPMSMAGPIKIGCSQMPDNRLLSLSTWSPFPLEIIAKVEGGFALEKRLHNRFSASLSHREWFHPTPDLLAAIASIQKGEPIEAAVDFSATPARPPLIRPARSPSFCRRMSYQHKLRHAQNRASEAMGVIMFVPQAAQAIMERWAGWGKNPQRIDPAPDEIILLDAVISDPMKFCVPSQIRFPEARAS